GITTRITDDCSKFKDILREKQIGDEVAIFKTYSNVPLKRENKNVYLLSSGVGLATFRPLILDYLNNATNVNQLHSLNIDSTNHDLFSPTLESAPEKGFTTQFVNNRHDYYEEVKNLAADQDALSYVVGSDEILTENIQPVQEHRVPAEQLLHDKHADQRQDFSSLNVSM